MVLESNYLPNIEYFALLLSTKNENSNFDKDENTIQIEIHENYQKQSYRNRCKILTTNKIDQLIVPVKKDSLKQIIKDIRIEYTQDWHRQHIGAIKAAYGKAPFFEYFFDYFNLIYSKKHDFLIDLNFEILTVCLKLMKINLNIKFTENYEINLLDDFRGTIHPKLDSNRLNVYLPFVYSQNFGNNFVPNLSVLDLLMCQGPLAAQIIENSTNKVNIFTASGVLTE